MDLPQELTIFLAHAQDCNLELVSFKNIIRARLQDRLDDYLRINPDLIDVYRTLKIFFWEADAETTPGGQKRQIDPILKQAPIAAFLIKDRIGNGTEYELNLARKDKEKHILVFASKQHSEASPSDKTNSEWSTRVQKLEALTAGWDQNASNSIRSIPRFGDKQDLIELAEEWLDKAVRKTLARKVVELKRDSDLNSSPPTTGLGALAAAHDQLNDFFKSIASESFLDKDHPLFFGLTGLWHWLLDQFQRRPLSVEFAFHPAVYPGILAALARSPVATKARAIADTSDELEKNYLWTSATLDAAKTSVAERIFLISIAKLFDDKSLAEFAKQLGKIVKAYPVRVGISGNNASDVPHPLGGNAVGENLLLVPPNCVGGYVIHKNEPHLQLKVDDGRSYEAAELYYESIRGNTVEFKPGTDANALRRQFIQREGYGKWDTRWREVGRRSFDYFEKYDVNIRCWCPLYDDMITSCLKVIKQAICSRLRDVSHALKIKEVGYGTGGLTKPLLGWLNKLLIDTNAVEPWISSYEAIDSAEQMRNLLSPAVRQIDSKGLCNLQVGEFGSVDETESGFDLVFGSLVLHELLGVNPAESLDSVFSAFQKCTRPGGVLVFADVFVRNIEEVAHWKEWMEWMGMTKEQVNEFLDCNQDMISTVNERQLQKVGSDHGFSVEGLRAITTTRSKLKPFRIMVARRDDN